MKWKEHPSLSTGIKLRRRLVSTVTGNRLYTLSRHWIVRAFWWNISSMASRLDSTTWCLVIRSLTECWYSSLAVSNYCLWSYYS